jgi:uncharacterized protein YgiM (DUF1202 family)
MRRLRRYGLYLAFALAAVAAVAATRTLSVQVREGQLRERPSFLGKVTTAVAYGDRLTVLEERAGWSKVRSGGGAEGWIHTSALTEKRVVLKASDANVAAGASGEELALAGKGFNEEVEQAYRADNPQADYAWVDRMEAVVVNAEEAVAFLAAGDVAPKGGE